MAALLGTLVKSIAIQYNSCHKFYLYKANNSLFFGDIVVKCEISVSIVLFVLSRNSGFRYIPIRQTNVNFS